MIDVSDDELRVWTLRLTGEHPAAHGPLALDLRVRGDDGREVITFAEPRVHAVHRGVEKLFESRDYRQALMLADRHDWHSAFSSELGLALLLESKLGLAVPERATWIRTLLAELNRAIHHLRWLGETATVYVTDPELGEVARSAREQLTDLHESATGGRLHPMLVQPGGLRSDLDDDWLRSCAAATAAARPAADRLRAWAEEIVDLAGIGVLPYEQALVYGTSGPLARASGLGLDLRLDDPYCAYPALAAAGTLRRVTRTAGDAAARMQVLAEQLAVSFDCLDACVAQLFEIAGPISVRLPRALRVPEGTGYGWTENPTGINGWYLVSRGDTEPYRLKLRTASFNNAQALAAALVGTDVVDLPATLMSYLLVAGDLGK